MEESVWRVERWINRQRNQRLQMDEMIGGGLSILHQSATQSTFQLHHFASFRSISSTILHPNQQIK